MNENQKTNTDIVQGIDLKIDSAVEKLCEVSNSTSSSTRSVWYIIVIVSTLSFAEFWNTHPWNVTSQRIHDMRDSIFVLQNKLLNSQNLANCKFDGVADTSRLKFDIQFNKSLLDIFNRSINDNIYTIKIPILGNAFDVRDLGIFAGFAFIVLLLILKYILIRKVSNLQVTLQAVTKRYAKDSNEKDFTEFLEGKSEEQKQYLLEQINLARRKYHYNFLTMNEVFNIIPDTSIKHGLDKTIEWFRRKIFFIPLYMCILLLINDLVNFYLRTPKQYTASYILSVVISCFYMFSIGLLGKKCKDQSDELESIYSDFKKNNYKCEEGIN